MTLIMFSIPTFTGLLHTGQLVIPPGVRNFSINVLSGSATINSVNCPAPYSLTIGLPDSKNIIAPNYGIVVGCTGVGNKTVVYWNN